MISVKNIILVILFVLLIIDVLAMIICKILDLKNENTYKNITKINYAIYRYQIDCITNNVESIIDYSDMEDYDKTFWRLWDWGYTRILPKDKFEIIQPYIK